MSTDLKHKVDTDDQSFIEDPKLAAQIEAANAVDIPDRARKEKKLLWKLDARFSILIVVYILNYIDRNVGLSILLGCGSFGGCWVSRPLLVGLGLTSVRSPLQNLSAAKTQGLEADLGLVGSQYPTRASAPALSLLFEFFLTSCSFCRLVRRSPYSQFSRSSMSVTSSCACLFPSSSSRGHSAKDLSLSYVCRQVPSNALVQYTGRPSIYLPVCMTIWGLISLLSGVTKNFVGMLMTRFFLGFVEGEFSSPLVSLRASR